MRVQGVEETIAAFGRMDKRVRAQLRKGVQRWLEMVASESQHEVPFITGGLAHSMEVTVHARSAAGSIRYTAPYAAIVHEVPRPASSNGKWQYLADPFKRLSGIADEVIGGPIEEVLR